MNSPVLTNKSPELTTAKNPGGRFFKETQMQAAVLKGDRKIALVEREIPSPGANQVLIKVEGCGVCGSNMPVWEGRHWFKYPLEPGAPGHEAWGRIAAIGKNVQRFSVGQRVVMLSQQAFAEYDLADENLTVPLPGELSPQPFPGEPLACAMNIFRRCDIRAYHTVVIIGIGFLGALLTNLAVKTGARVIAISRRPFALEIARQYGAAETIELTDDTEVREILGNLTNGEGSPRVIEATGLQQPLNLAGEIAAVRGRLIIAGYHQDGLRDIPLQLWNWKGIDVINAHERSPKIYIRGMQEAIEAVISGRLNPAPLYTHFIPLENISRAFELMESRPEKFMKAIITCGDKK